MTEIVNASRLEQLRALLVVLANKVDSNPGARDLAQLSKQYRETLQEIEDLEGLQASDAIADILKKRTAAGKPGPVREIRNGEAM